MLSYSQYLKERYVEDIIKDENLDENFVKDMMDVKGQEGSLKGLAYDFVPGLSLARAVKRYKSGMTGGAEAAADIGLGALESIPGVGTLAGKIGKGIFKAGKFLMRAKKAEPAAAAATKKPSIARRVVSAPFKAIDKSLPVTAPAAVTATAIDTYKRPSEWNQKGK